MKKMQIEIGLCFISRPPPKVRYFALKKSSFVLASISKKCKLKLDKKHSFSAEYFDWNFQWNISPYHALSGTGGVSTLRHG